MTVKIPRKLHIEHSPAQNQIVCGSKSVVRGDWSNNTQDVTSDACVAVAEYILQSKNPTYITEDGDSVYQIHVKKL